MKIREQEKEIKVLQSLANKYRPQTFDDVYGQLSTKIILKQQIETRTFKQAVLFVGPAGCGKTTCARIFAKAINHGQGNPIEIDAASNNSVEDIRKLSVQAKTKSLDSEYKVFILDEIHMLSGGAWAAMLKLIEEPPAKTVFIGCTTDYQKIPKTILSRCQRFDFQRIPEDDITIRLQYVCNEEAVSPEDEALKYIARLADGGMRDALTMLDKCLAYSTNFTLEEAVDILGAVDYDMMFLLTKAILKLQPKEVIAIIEDIHNNGKDLKLFIKQYIQFLLDVAKYDVCGNWEFLSIPRLQEYINILEYDYNRIEFDRCRELLKSVMRLSGDIKYSQTVKYDVEACLILEAINDRTE